MNKNSVLKNRLIFYLLALIVFLFFVNDYALVSAEKVAIVVALGIDKSDEGFTVSAEVAIPPAPTNDKSAEGRRSVLVTSGATISEAVSKLALNTGWYPKLNFCNLILLSEEIAKDGAMKALEYFLRSERIMDSALLLIAKGCSCKDILETATPLDNLSSFSLEKIAFQRYLSYSDVVASNLKDFAKNYFDRGVSNIVAAVEIKDLLAESSEVAKQNALKGDYDLFDLTYSALFDYDKLSGYLGPDETTAYNYINKNVNDSSFLVKDVFIPYTTNEVADYTLDIVKHKKDLSPKIENGKLVCDVYLEMYVRLADSSTINSSIIGMTTLNDIPPVLSSAAAVQVTNHLNRTFNKLKEANVDPYGLGRTLNAYSHKEWEEFITADNFYTYPKDIEYNVVVTVRTFTDLEKR